MNERLIFGIVGGYGATGTAAASEIWKSGAGDIVIGGHDPAKGKAFAAQFDHSVSSVHVDALDGCSLDSFCDAYSIIVNCGGPVMASQD
jgi:saccharopine dehydrogenase-like NADP-dependent oxidoreductase